MLRIRIIAVATAAAIASILSANSAKAQTASAGQTGQPLSLSQLLTQTTASPAQPANSTAPSRRHVRRIARRRHRSATRHANQADDPPPDNASVDDRLGANATPAEPAPASPTAPAAETDRAQQDDASLPAAVVVGGQTVPIAAADQINALDMAADNSPPTVPMPPRGDGADAAPSDTSAALQAAFDVQAPAIQEQNGDAAQNADAQERAPQAMGEQAVSVQDMSDQKAGAENSAAVGSTAWIAQVLAALGGAIAAGVLAWFLIGDGPVRTYR